MKPIEEGCLAIVVSGLYTISPNVGKVVKVGKFIGQHICFENFVDDLWEVNIPMIDDIGRKVYMQQEKNLMRIDGLEESVTQEEEQEVKA